MSMQSLCIKTVQIIIIEFSCIHIHFSLHLQNFVVVSGRDRSNEDALHKLNHSRAVLCQNISFYALYLHTSLSLCNEIIYAHIYLIVNIFMSSCSMHDLRYFSILGSVLSRCSWKILGVHGSDSSDKTCHCSDTNNKMYDSF